MQLYLYSSQDLIVSGDRTVNIRANAICSINLQQDEIIYIYSVNCYGCIALNKEIIQNKVHSQIVFHQPNKELLICEIKPFVDYQNVLEYNVSNTHIQIFRNPNSSAIYVNGKYYGVIYDSADNIKFEKLKKNQSDYGVIEIIGKDKYIIILSDNGIEFCTKYYDYEILSDTIKIYRNIPNVFNLGQLVIYNFKTKQIEYKQVLDRGDELRIISKDFCLIYFVEAIKCGRFKYAYNQLSYELKSVINIDTLKKYFPQFDNYIYLEKEDIFIMINNKKIVGIYNIKIKNNLISNIY